MWNYGCILLGVDVRKMSASHIGLNLIFAPFSGVSGFSPGVKGQWKDIDEPLWIV